MVVRIEIDIQDEEDIATIMELIDLVVDEMTERFLNLIVRDDD